MIFLTAVEMILVALISYFLATQVIIPLWRGSRLFPFLEKESKLNRELAAAEQSVHEAEIAQEIYRRQEAAESISPTKRKERKKHGTT